MCTYLQREVERDVASSRNGSHQFIPRPNSTKRKPFTVRCKAHTLKDTSCGRLSLSPCGDTVMLNTVIHTCTSQDVPENPCSEMNTWHRIVGHTSSHPKGIVYCTCWHICANKIVFVRVIVHLDEHFPICAVMPAGKARRRPKAGPGLRADSPGIFGSAVVVVEGATTLLAPANAASLLALSVSE